MNLWVKKTGLIFGLALFIFACDEPGEIGLDINPEQENFVVSSMEIPLDVSVGKSAPYLLYDTEDKGLQVINIGVMDDPKFGKITSEGFAQVVPNSDTVKLPSTAVYYKTVLKLYATNIKVDPSNINKEQIVRVHALKEEMDSVNYSNTTYNYQPEPLTEIKFHLDSLVSSITASADLPDTLGQRIFAEVKDDSLLNAEELSKIIKGVAFIPDEENNMLFSLHPFSESVTGIEVGYINNKDTFAIRYLFEGIHSSHVESDFTGSAELASLQSGGDILNDTQYGYVGALDGIYSQLDLSPILHLRDSINGTSGQNKIVINNARLFLENAVADSLYRTTSSIYAYGKTDDLSLPNLPYFYYANNAFFNLDKIDYSFRFSLVAEVDSDGDKTGQYYVGLTLPNRYTASNRGARFEDYIQSLMAGDAKETNIILASSAFGTSFDRLVFRKNKVKLKIYFSYLKDQSTEN